METVSIVPVNMLYRTILDAVLLAIYRVWPLSLKASLVGMLVSGTGVPMVAVSGVIATSDFPSVEEEPVDTLAINLRLYGSYTM